MIILLLLMASVIVVPMSVEVLRSPDDNLVSDTKHEIVESVIKPVQEKIDNLSEEAALRVSQAVTASLFSRFLSYILKLISNFLK